MYRVSATLNKKRITSSKLFNTRQRAQKFADYINSKRPGANARVVQA